MSNRKGDQNKLAKAFDSEISSVSFGRALRYHVDKSDISGGYAFPPSGDLLDEETPVVDVHLEDWSTELRKGSGYYLTEAGFQGSDDPDHSAYVADTFARYLEIGLERCFVNYWQRPQTRLSCGLTAEEAASRVGELPYRKPLNVTVGGLDEIAAEEVVACNCRVGRLKSVARARRKGA